MSYYTGIVLVLFVALLEASVLPLFSVRGIQPNLTLVFLITWLFIRGEEEIYVLVPAGGIALGLVGGSLLGTALLALAPMILLQELRRAQLNEGGIVMAIVFTAVMSLVYNYTYLSVFFLQGQSGNWLEASTNVVLPAAFINVAVLLPLFWVFSILNPEPRRSLYA